MWQGASMLVLIKKTSNIKNFLEVIQGIKQDYLKQVVNVNKSWNLITNKENENLVGFMYTELWNETKLIRRKHKRCEKLLESM